MTTNVRRSVVLALAAVSALGPFAIDMYLSSLPHISEEFSAPTWATQLTLTGYLLVLGVGQLVAGPVADAYGRRRPLLAGLLAFVVGSLLAAVSPSMTILVIARLIQAIGGAIGIVVINSSVRDYARGEAATKLYALLLTVGGFAPVIAPAVGGFLDGTFGWRSVFWVLTAFGLLVFALAYRWLPESLPPADRSPFALKSTMRAYQSLLGTPGIFIPLVGFSFVFMLLFGYIGGASYVYQGEYGISASTFGIVFGATGLSMLAGAIAAGRLSAPLGTYGLALLGAALMVTGTAIATASVAAGLPLALVVAGLWIALFGLGAGEPAFMSTVMSGVRHHSGQAAALIGASQYLLGALASSISGTLASNSGVQWAGFILVCAVLALVFAFRSPKAGGVASTSPH